MPEWKKLFFDGTGDDCNMFELNSTCNLVRFCNRTAFIITETEARAKYFKMRSDGIQNVYLSKETLLKNEFVVLIGRWISPKILLRLDGLFSSGITK